MSATVAPCYRKHVKEGTESLWTVNDGTDGTGEVISLLLGTHGVT